MTGCPTRVPQWRLVRPKSICRWKALRVRGERRIAECCQGEVPLIEGGEAEAEHEIVCWDSRAQEARDGFMFSAELMAALGTHGTESCHPLASTHVSRVFWRQKRNPVNSGFLRRVKEGIYASLDRLAEHSRARKLMVQTHHAIGSALGAGNHDDDGFRTGENRVIGAIGKLHPEALMMDIGANNGSWTLEICARLPNARVIAVEPGFDALRTLHARLNADSRVIVLPVAIGEVDGTAALFGIDNGLQASLRPEVLSRTTRVGQSDIPTQEATVVTWVTLIESLRPSSIDLNHDPLTAIKIDVEGLELDILRQIAAWRGFASVEFVQFEFHMHALAQGQLIADFQEILGSDFELFRLTKHALIPRRELDESSENFFGFSNWLAVRKHSVQEFLAAFSASSGKRRRPYEWRR